MACYCAAMTRALTALLFLFGPALAACCMVPADYRGDVDQSRQEVVIVHRNGHQEMAIRVLPFFKDAADNPAQLTWILTLPSTPTGFSQTDAEVFRQGRDLYQRMFQLARQQWAAKTDFSVGMPGANDAASGQADLAGLDVGATVQVGPYTVTPVKAQGKEALENLNLWLADRGFPREDPAHLAWFVENNFTFLCIHFKPPSGKAAALQLPALQVGFDTEAVYYPGKFSSRQGNFALDMTVLSDKPLELDNLMAQRERLNDSPNDRVVLHNIWTSKPLPELLLGLAGKAETPAKWYINRIDSPGFNASDEEGQPAIAAWKDDVFFKTGGTPDELPGFWYYGDADISWPERMFREHALAGIILGSALMFLVLVLKGRQNRRRYMEQQARNKPATQG